MTPDGILLSLVLPAGVAAAFVACGLLAGGRLAPVLTALALAVGYTVAEVAARGFVGWWPTDPSRRVPWFLGLVVAVTAWEAVLARPSLCRGRRLLIHGARMTAAAAAAFLLIRATRSEPDAAQMWLVALGAAAAYIGGQWLLLDRVARSANPWPLWVLPASALTGAVVMELTGWAGLSRAFTALGACLLVVLACSSRPRAALLAGVTGGFALAYGTLVWCAFWFGDVSAPAAGLLAVAPLLACAAPLWPRGRLVLAMCLLAPLIAATALVLPETLDRGASPGGPYPDYCYVAVYGDNRITILAVDPARGTLRPALDVQTPGKPVCFTFDVERLRLFASLTAPDQLASFRIDPQTGGLTLINAVRADAITTSLATDRTGRFLLSASWGDGRVSVHAIGPDGAIGPEPVQSFATAPEAHHTVLDPSERFAVVLHTSEIGGIRLFHFDATTGKLTPSHDSPSVPKDSGPRHLLFHPSCDVAYVVNEGIGSVTAFAVDPAAETLRSFQTVSTLPDDYRGFNACAEIGLHPSGRFMYASNRGHDSVACFRIDPADGRLTPLGQVATERMPWSIDLEPSGRLLLVAGQAWGRLAVYRVDEASGALKRVGIHEVGSDLRWVRTVRLPAN